jgi:AmmeMemoRadiSam system protein A
MTVGLFSPTDQKKILVYARELLKARLMEGAEPDLKLRREVMEEKRGIFVTLRIRGCLRGCIGHILGDEPLGKSIRNMTLAAAFEDPRFPPLTAGELEDLKIHISILTEPMPVKSYKDIRAGTDGIIVSRGWKKGVYLPEVATETGWDARTFFENCALEKAGLTEQELSEALIEVFQTEGFED